MRVDVKTYKLSSSLSLLCATDRNRITGEISYTLQVICYILPWEEVIEEFSTKDKSIANKQFKELVAKYKE